MEFLRDIGLSQTELTVKSDGEPAMGCIVRELCRLRAAECARGTVVEKSGVGDSAGNGIAERAIRSIQEQMRVARSALEERWGSAWLLGILRGRGLQNMWRFY